MALEGALEMAAEPQAAFNLAVCTSALGDVEHARLCLTRLVQVKALS